MPPRPNGSIRSRIIKKDRIMPSRSLAALTALSLIVAPTAALAAPSSDAAALSLRNSSRIGAELEDPNQIQGSLIIIGAIAVAVIVLFFVLLDDDDDDVPESP